MGFKVKLVPHEEPSVETEALVRLTNDVHTVDLEEFQHNLHVRNLVTASDDAAEAYAQAWGDKRDAARA